MPLVPIKNIFWFSHNKWDKHLISSKKDLSQVPMFVSHNGIHFNRRLFVNSFGRTIWFSRWFPLGTLERTARLGWKCNPMHTSLRMFYYHVASPVFTTVQGSELLRKSSIFVNFNSSKNVFIHMIVKWTVQTFWSLDCNGPKFLKMSLRK